MSRRRPHRHARRRANLAGIALIGVAFAALAGLAFAGLLLRAAPVDPETLCRTDRPVAAHAFILIDATDRLERRHKRRLDAVAAQERARLGQYDRLTLARLNARRPQEPTILFSKCLPKPPEQANPLFENPRLAQERWEADFAGALERATRNAAQAAAQGASPIVAGIRAAAADPGFDAAIARRRLVIVSDMLENEPRGFSLYAADSSYAAWLARAPQGPPDLSRIDVRVVPLDRPDHAARQAAALEGFWPDFLSAAEARTVSIDPSY